MYPEWGKREMRIGIGGKARGKQTFGRPRHRWVDNIKMDLLDIVWGCVDQFMV
jgi:hypothetical protein